ncbi:hypothetical protein [Bartonella birtlesii]|uniref:hypothetical protein n=1 Tax=Bartonella birtlesii TaxID=111504 RepID=UPI00036BB6FD|nr:hypothetical protein [Bartonella birtlesii]
MLFFKTDSGGVKNHKCQFQDSVHPRYALKFAAAVAVWKVVSGAESGKIVKQTLAKWLQQNADQYNLRDKKNNKLKKGVIEQLANFAHWKSIGGAPKIFVN